ncbi:hypothetical protein DL770_001962 [Monosporascus sp. CRB-9-2]|nr:hypothetical protein DL770_001962 [Monosporascus sp. CRB-9-2]
MTTITEDSNSVPASISKLIETVAEHGTKDNEELSVTFLDRLASHQADPARVLEDEVVMYVAENYMIFTDQIAVSELLKRATDLSCVPEDSHELSSKLPELLVKSLIAGFARVKDMYERQVAEAEEGAYVEAKLFWYNINCFTNSLVAVMKIEDPRGDWVPGEELSMPQ